MSPEREQDGTDSGEGGGAWNKKTQGSLVSTRPKPSSPEVEDPGDGWAPVE